MCGRYVSKTDADLEREWGLRRPPPLFGSYNVTPGTRVPVVRLMPDGGREAMLAHWGLIPFWARGVAPKYSTINATCERVQTAPAYRGPWKRAQRCLFPVNGFYEWQAVPGQKAKQPWYIHVRGQERFALGGLWERSQGEDGATVESCTIITVPANPMLAEIHNTKKRMPLIVPPDSFGAWLSGDNDEAQDILRAYPDSELEAWEVSTFVNSPKNDDERCCAPQGHGDTDLFTRP